MTPPPSSPLPDAAAPWQGRLVEQLRLLSEISETLTYRLLDLEERLGAAEREMAELRQAIPAAGELSPQMEPWLEEVEMRLRDMERLLQDRDGPDPGSSRSLQALAGGARFGSRPAQPSAVDRDLEDPFPDEGEQPFLDEEIA